MRPSADPVRAPGHRVPRAADAPEPEGHDPPPCRALPIAPAVKPAAHVAGLEAEELTDRDEREGGAVVVRREPVGGSVHAAPVEQGECQRAPLHRSVPETTPVPTRRRAADRLSFARRAAAEAAERGDDGTNDLLVSDVIRTHEQQVWFLAEHLVETPLVRDER